MSRRSLRFRLLLAAAQSITQAQVIAGAGLTALFERHVERRLEAGLDETLGRILGELVSRTSLILMSYGQHSRTASPQPGGCGCKDHQALLDAMRLGDRLVAMRLMQEHLSEVESGLRFAPPRGVVPDFLALFQTTYAPLAAD